MDNGNNNQKPQPGTGSAENQGRGREEQMNQGVDQQGKDKIAEEAGLDRNDLTDIRELGQLSGRDDYAGGDNDGMSEQSTGQPTDR
jgi:hypothetical protein